MSEAILINIFTRDPHIGRAGGVDLGTVVSLLSTYPTNSQLFGTVGL